jgi:hypothetical protein
VILELRGGALWVPQVLQSVKSSGLQPNIFCYGAAAKSCLATSRWREALQVSTLGA